LARRTPLLPEPAPSAHEHRTIIVAPTGKDGRLIASLLERLTIPCHVASSVSEACALIREGAGAAILSEEAFVNGSMGELLQVLQQQPSWSDFPLILLTVSGRVTIESERLREMRRPLGNLFLLERPIRPETLRSTLEIALRGRERQYQIRDQIEQYARAQEALLRSEKLAVTGRLAASIAHEINNPLEAVTNLLFLLRDEASSELQKKFLALAEQELARVAEITKQTLRFYREPSQPTATRVATVLDSVLMLFSPRLVSAGIEVERSERAPSATVLSSPGELRQVIANIIGNAIDAMRSGGRLRIRIAEAGQCVRLTIADSGMGIPRDVLPTIFEPFVTTKGETGTGLGLWVTAQIINRNGWKIRVRSCSRPGRSGTTFYIVIPALHSAKPLSEIAAQIAR
jgi:signal transduction histidine kinase